MFGHDRAVVGDVRSQVAMRRRINDVEAVSDQSDRAANALECPLMAGGIDSTRQATGDRNPCLLYTSDAADE